MTRYSRTQRQQIAALNLRTPLARYPFDKYGVTGFRYAERDAIAHVLFANLDEEFSEAQFAKAVGICSSHLPAATGWAESLFRGRIFEARTPLSGLELLARYHYTRTEDDNWHFRDLETYTSPHVQEDRSLAVEGERVYSELDFDPVLRLQGHRLRVIRTDGTKFIHRFFQGVTTDSPARLQSQLDQQLYYQDAYLGPSAQALAASSSEPSTSSRHAASSLPATATSGARAPFSVRASSLQAPTAPSAASTAPATSTVSHQVHVGERWGPHQRTRRPSTERAQREKEVARWRPVHLFVNIGILVPNLTLVNQLLLYAEDYAEDAADSEHFLRELEDEFVGHFDIRADQWIPNAEKTLEYSIFRSPKHHSALGGAERKQELKITDQCLRTFTQQRQFLHLPGVLLDVKKIASLTGDSDHFFTTFAWWLLQLSGGRYLHGYEVLEGPTHHIIYYIRALGLACREHFLRETDNLGDNFLYDRLLELCPGGVSTAGEMAATPAPAVDDDGCFVFFNWPLKEPLFLPMKPGGKSGHWDLSTLTGASGIRLYNHITSVPSTFCLPPPGVRLEDCVVGWLIRSKAIGARYLCLFWPWDFDSKGNVLAARIQAGRPSIVQDDQGRWRYERVADSYVLCGMGFLLQHFTEDVVMDWGPGTKRDKATGCYPWQLSEVSAKGKSGLSPAMDLPEVEMEIIHFPLTIDTERTTQEDLAHFQACEIPQVREGLAAQKLGPVTAATYADLERPDMPVRHENHCKLDDAEKARVAQLNMYDPAQVNPMFSLVIPGAERVYAPANGVEYVDPPESAIRTKAVDKLVDDASSSTDNDGAPRHRTSPRKPGRKPPTEMDFDPSTHAEYDQALQAAGGDHAAALKATKAAQQNRRSQQNPQQTQTSQSAQNSAQNSGTAASTGAAPQQAAGHQKEQGTQESSDSENEEAAKKAMFENTPEPEPRSPEPSGTAQPSVLLMDTMFALAQQAHFTFTSALGLAAREAEWLVETNGKMREAEEGSAIKTLVSTAKVLGTSIDSHLMQASTTYRQSLLTLENLAARGIQSGELSTMPPVPDITAARMSKATGAYATVAHDAYAFLHKHAQGADSKTSNRYKERALPLPATPAEIVPADNAMLRDYIAALQVSMARALPTLSDGDNKHRHLRTETALALGIPESSATASLILVPIEPDDTTRTAAKPKPVVAPKPPALQARAASQTASQPQSPAPTSIFGPRSPTPAKRTSSVADPGSEQSETKRPGRRRAPETSSPAVTSSSTPAVSGRRRATEISSPAPTKPKAKPEAKKTGKGKGKK